MKSKTVTALRAVFSDGVKSVLFPHGNFAFGDIIDDGDSVVTPVLVLFASGQPKEGGECEVIRFGQRDSKEVTRIESLREIPVVFRETTFLLPSSAQRVKCGGFKFGGKTVTSVKQFVYSYEE